MADTTTVTLTMVKVSNYFYRCYILPRVILFILPSIFLFIVFGVLLGCVFGVSVFSWWGLGSVVGQLLGFSELQSSIYEC